MYGDILLLNLTFPRSFVISMWKKGITSYSLMRLPENKGILLDLVETWCATLETLGAEDESRQMKEWFLMRIESCSSLNIFQMAGFSERTIKKIFGDEEPDLRILVSRILDRKESNLLEKMNLMERHAMNKFLEEWVVFQKTEGREVFWDDNYESFEDFYHELIHRIILDYFPGTWVSDFAEERLIIDFDRSRLCVDVKDGAYKMEISLSPDQCRDIADAFVSVNWKKASTTIDPHTILDAPKWYTLIEYGTPLKRKEYRGISLPEDYELFRKTIRKIIDSITRKRNLL